MNIKEAPLLSRLVLHTATLAFWIIVFDLLLLEILTFRLHSLLPLVGQTEYYSSASVHVFRLCVFASAGNCVLLGGGGHVPVCVTCGHIHKNVPQP